MDDLREELHAAITKAEEVFAENVTMAMVRRAEMVNEAIEAHQKAFDLRMATFNGIEPIKEPVVRDVRMIGVSSVEAEFETFPSVVTNRANGAQV
jgi:hypothetical protein